MFTNPSREMRPQAIGNRLFIGTVVDNNDPRRLQRVRVSCPDMWEGIEVTDLPWFMPIGAATMGNRPGMGTLAPLAVGSRVWVGFLDDTPYNPVVWGSATTEDTQLGELTASGYPHAHGFIDQSGNCFIVDTAANTVSFTHVSGFNISIGADGKPTITSPVDLDINVTGNTIVKSSGNADVHAAGDCNVAGGGTVTISGGGAVNINGGAVNINGGSVVSPIAPSAAVARGRPG